MRLVFVILLIASILLPVSAGSGAPVAPNQAVQPLTLTGYWAQVEQTRQIVSDLQMMSAPAVRSRLDELAAEWEATTQVELPDGSLLHLDPSELVALFRSAPPQLSAILARLDALLAARQQLPQRAFTQKDVDGLSKILAASEFQWAEPTTIPVPKWWDAFWNKVFQWLNRVLGWTGMGVAGPIGNIVLTWVLAILLIGILVYAGRGLVSSLVKEAELAEEGSDGQENLTSETALQRAQALSSGGNYRRAVRYLYLSALLLLDERGLLRYDRSKTNREYLRSLRGIPTLEKPMRAVIDIFDRVWYGFEDIDQDTYQDYVNQVGELRKQKR